MNYSEKVNNLTIGDLRRVIEFAESAHRGIGEAIYDIECLSAYVYATQSGDDKRLFDLLSLSSVKQQLSNFILIASKQIIGLQELEDEL